MSGIPQKARLGTMRYIALEEAFSIPELDARQSGPPLGIRLSRSYAEEVGRKLSDFTEFRLPEMDASGIDIQVLSLTVPGLQLDLDPTTATDNARFANDYLAKVVANHPSRFAGFAALPLQDPDAAVEELARCVGELGFCGALVNDHTQGRYLDHPSYDALWGELARLNVPLYLHPGSVPVDRWHVIDGRPEIYGATWSWGAETGGHALRVVYSGVFDRHPDARLILGHMGEFLPFQLTRLDSRYLTLETDRPLRRMPSQYFGPNVLLTTSGVFSPPALTGAVLAVGADAVMFSVDYPYESSQAAVDAFERTTLSDSDRAKIAHGNAERILRIAS
jgi:2,3-dihydroxybenzoate decarboxylase